MHGVSLENWIFLVKRYLPVLDPKVFARELADEQRARFDTLFAELLECLLQRRQRALSLKKTLLQLRTRENDIANRYEVHLEAASNSQIASGTQGTSSNREFTVLSAIQPLFKSSHSEIERQAIRSVRQLARSIRQSNDMLERVHARTVLKRRTIAAFRDLENRSRSA